MPNRVLVVFGTRPEAIKMAPVVRALGAFPELEPVIAVTAQHREMLDQVLDLFEIVPDYDLDIMEHGQSLTRLNSRVLAGIGEILEEQPYDAVVVHGDTTTTFASALAAFYHHVPVGHVEAGMRTGDIRHPFPEEANRSLVARLAQWNFPPSAECENHLLREGIDPTLIFRTCGNTVIDALLLAAEKKHEFPAGAIRSALDSGKRIVLVTTHRRESWGRPMENILGAIRRLARLHPEARFLFAAHANPIVGEAARRVLDGVEGAIIIGPQDYLSFVNLMSRADLILSDSGGIQEEGPAVGTPVVVLRDVTEYGEMLEAGAVVLAGTEEQSIVGTVSSLLGNEEALSRMSRAGKGTVRRGASRQIAETLMKQLTASSSGDD